MLILDRHSLFEAAAESPNSSFEPVTFRPVAADLESMTERDRVTFDRIKAAVLLELVELQDYVDLNTGKLVSIVCIPDQDLNGDIEMVPLARLVSGDDRLRAPHRP